MFAVSPVGPSSVAALTPLQAHAPERVASVIAGALPVPVALDPRLTYALSTQTADAVLSLVQARAPGQDTAAIVPQSPEPPQTNDAQNAVEPARDGYARSDIEAGSASANPAHPVGGSDTPASADPNAVERKAVRQAEEAARWDAHLDGITQVDMNLVSAITFYLLCNDSHYKDFKTEHPGLDIHWINVDNKKIVSVWPKITDQWFPPR